MEKQGKARDYFGLQHLELNMELVSEGSVEDREEEGNRLLSSLLSVSFISKDLDALPEQMKCHLLENGVVSLTSSSCSQKHWKRNQCHGEGLKGEGKL